MEKLPPRTVLKLNEQVMAAIEAGDLPKSTTLSRVMLDVVAKHYGQENTLYLGVSDRLAGLCYVQGQYLPAQHLLDRSLLLRRKSLGRTSLSVAENAEHLALTHIRQNHLREAVKLLSQAAALRYRISGELPAFLRLGQNAELVGGVVGAVLVGEILPWLAPGLADQFARKVEENQEFLLRAAHSIEESFFQSLTELDLEAITEAGEGAPQVQGHSSKGSRESSDDPEPQNPSFDVSSPDEPPPPSPGSAPPLEPPPPAPEPESPGSLTRFPNLECPDWTPLGEPFSLYVQLLIEPPQEGAEGVEIADEGHPTSLPKVEVVLRSPGFRITEGSNIRPLEVKRDADSEARFTLEPLSAGRKKIVAEFYQDGCYLGVTPDHWIEVAEDQEPAVEKQEKATYPFILQGSNQPTPYLQIRIVCENCLDGEGKRTLKFELSSVPNNIPGGIFVKEAGEITLSSTPQEKFQEVYEKLNGLARQGAGRHVGSNPEEDQPLGEPHYISEEQLADLGNQLWDELIPDEMKAAYWEIKDRFSSLLIVSDEPYIPWEMVKPYRYDEDGVPADNPFWCQQFAMARWLAVSAGPEYNLKLRSVQPVIAAIGNLPKAVEEVEFVRRLNQHWKDVETLEPIDRWLALKERLESGTFSLMHFACHGIFNALQPGDSSIPFADGGFSANNFRTRFIGKRQRPLVFINACHGGRQSYSFTGLGGWATAFINSLVGAFIGAQWEVDDALALQFAEKFYLNLTKNGTTLAEAFRETREEVRQSAPHNSTWLAYVLYAAPVGTVIPERGGG